MKNPLNSLIIAIILISAFTVNSLALTQVSSPMNMNIPGERYELINDVSYSGTPFQIEADGIIFDLNGHSITFHTSGSGGASGIDIVADNVTVTSSNGYGTISQSANVSRSTDRGSDDHAIAARRYPDGLTIENLTINIHGYDTFGIKVFGGDNESYPELITQNNNPKQCYQSYWYPSHKPT